MEHTAALQACSRTAPSQGSCVQQCWRQIPIVFPKPACLPSPTLLLSQVNQMSLLSQCGLSALATGPSPSSKGLSLLRAGPGPPHLSLHLWYCHRVGGEGRGLLTGSLEGPELIQCRQQILGGHCGNQAWSSGSVCSLRWPQPPPPPEP